ncbi:hypothetical protein SUGI_0283280 [Cryptomeria japonica]|nr:hypothetical protein SUGI_0283280 [Cryptomeria japonica]
MASGLELTNKGNGEIYDHSSSKDDDYKEVDDQSPIEEVALTVPTTDDPELPVLTFRVWVLGILSCGLLSMLNQFVAYRAHPINLTAVSAQIVVLPVGRFMAATLPTKRIRFPGTKWHFSLNPGPFNTKEHVLITIFASVGTSGVYAVNILTIIKAFYKRNMNPIAAWLLALTTQMLGFGWAGVFRKLLVESPYMWWPATLVQVSIFRALHEEEKRPKGGMTRMQFFIIVLTCSFAYYIVPTFFFPSISTISIACWIWKDSVTAQQIGSGLYGLGIGSFALDWATVAGFLGSPLATPWFAIANTMVGFILIVYVLLPITYWTNVYNAQKFPFISTNVFSDDGQPYNTSRVLKSDFTFDKDAYNQYSNLNMSGFFAISYGLSFATLAATVSHVLLFYGKSIWQQAKAAMTDRRMDVHTRLMKTNYKSVPQYWFLILLAVSMALALGACEGYNDDLQLRYWGLFLASGIAFVFTLPIGVIQATTNLQPGLNVITEYFIGYIYPGRPVANVAFKTYGYISMVQALSFVQDFKVGHYMKIPPRSMFIVQVVGTLVATFVYFGTAWWLLYSIKDICHPELLPPGSPWKCPSDDVFYNASIIWGVVGPQRIFGNLGLYKKQNWFFLVGILAPVPVWIFSKLFPKQKWIPYINMPIILSGSGAMPPGGSINYIS